MVPLGSCRSLISTWGLIPPSVRPVFISICPLIFLLSSISTDRDRGSLINRWISIQDGGRLPDQLIQHGRITIDNQPHEDVESTARPRSTLRTDKQTNRKRWDQSTRSDPKRRLSELDSTVTEYEIMRRIRLMRGGFPGFCWLFCWVVEAHRKAHSPWWPAH